MPKLVQVVLTFEAITPPKFTSHSISRNPENDIFMKRAVLGYGRALLPRFCVLWARLERCVIFSSYNLNFCVSFFILLLESSLLPIAATVLHTNCPLTHSSPWKYANFAYFQKTGHFSERGAFKTSQNKLLQAWFIHSFSQSAILTWNC